PAPFKNGQIPSGNNPKAGDYEEHVKNIINTACHQFEILVATEDPYPPPATTVVWATRVWADISRSTSATYQLSSRIEKIITSRTSHARGALRDRIRPHIESSYGFDRESTLDRVKQQNMARYTHILDRDSPSPEPRFYYADMENRQGFARHPIIMRVIQEHWFSAQDSPGILYAGQFSPIRDVSLALIFTTIEYCIDQWATGMYDKTLMFSNKVYRGKYQQHLRHIQEWCSIDPASSQAIRQRMYDRARRTSGAPAQVLPSTASLSETARDRLRRDLATQAAEGLE
ncbi:hypothetical protein BC628DRAFT_1324213, partial [Trametes gibbosa]